MRGLMWYAKRLRVMQPQELAFRFGEQFSLQRLRITQFMSKRGASSHDFARKFSFCSATERQLPVLPWRFQPSRAEINEMLAGTSAALDFKWTWRADDDVWRRAPDTGRVWPVRFFADINYREGNAVGDIRVAWEPSRLQQLVALALVSDGDDQVSSRRAVALIESELNSWVRSNPPWFGIHYVSAMECALRLIAVCHALDRVRGKLLHRDETWAALQMLVCSHADFIAKRISLHSSAGNHTIAECVGLVYAGMLFPELKGAALWRNRALSILAHEATRQILPDGGGVEQAFWYLLFITDLLGLTAELLLYKGVPVPHEIAAAVQRAKTFLNSFASSPELLPAIGDADGGYALSPYLRLSWNTTADDVTTLRTFADAGYTLLRSSRPGALSLVFDHGSLGMPPSCGHGHADALAVNVALNNEPVLLDAGTYLYTGAPQWRRYFRGTRAHNTVSVDGCDQAQQETAFLWSKKFHSQRVRSECVDDAVVRVLATHDGYDALGVTHWRGVVWRTGTTLLVWDYLEGDGEHALELNWHLARLPERTGDDGFALHGCSDIVRVRVLGGAVSVCSGTENPPHGWRSARYGQITATPVLSCRYRGPLPHEFVTLVTLDAAEITQRELERELTILRGWIHETKTN
jgi:hypothetical protein